MSGEWRTITNTEGETEALGGSLARLLEPGMFVALYGGLGAGKTAFCRGIGETLGIRDIASPTFTIVQEHRGKLLLYHFDVYRLSSAEELYDIGFEEYLEQDGVIVMEWPENTPDALPEERLEVHIEGSGEGPRKIVIFAVGQRYEPMIQRLEEDNAC